MEYRLKTCLNQLSNEARELYLFPDITILDAAPSPLVFLRDYVSKNRPVIIKNALAGWKALSKWTSDYLDKSIGSVQVSVTVTPHGYADAPLGDRFLLPEERLMPFRKFLSIWERKEKSNGVFYIQKQNSNFTDEFSQLITDADCHIGWASEAFGTKPDAVNFWMGNADSITSMHKDHYENLYAVVKGQKTFILHPPTDVPHIPYETYKLARYKENNNGTFDIIDICNDESDRHTGSNFLELGYSEQDGSNLSHSGAENYKSPESELISWIAIDPLNPDFDKYPQYACCQQYIARVFPGDLLYLPSLWFHHVTQSDRTIAVNFWYDMEYDIKYNYFRFAEAVSKAVYQKT